MKKILISISICAIALLAGCSKEVSNETDTETKEPQFVGNFIDESSRVTIGDYNPGDTKTPVFWNPNDKIGIYADYIGRISETNSNIEYKATTTTQAAATAFAKAGTTGVVIPPSTTGLVNYYTYYPYSTTMGTDFTKMPSPLKPKQSYDPISGASPDKVFMLATAEYKSPTASNIKLQYYNVYALVYIGVKGTAKINKVTVTNPNYYIGYSGGTINLKEAPPAGSDDNTFMGSDFFASSGAGTTSMSTECTSPLQLTSEITWIPIMTLPFACDEKNGGMNITISGKDKNGQSKQITRNIASKPSGGREVLVRSNSIAYLTLKDISTADLNQ